MYAVAQVGWGTALQAPGEILNQALGCASRKEWESHQDESLSQSCWPPAPPVGRALRRASYPAGSEMANGPPRLEARFVPVFSATRADGKSSQDRAPRWCWQAWYDAVHSRRAETIDCASVPTRRRPARISFAQRPCSAAPTTSGCIHSFSR